MGAVGRVIDDRGVAARSRDADRWSTTSVASEDVTADGEDPPVDAPDAEDVLEDANDPADIEGAESP
jgi:hypothetical protein